MLHRPLHLLCLSLLAFFAPVVLAAPSPTGAWQHRVALDLPPAPRGTAPSLSLVSDARVTGASAIESVVGTGWRFDGLSSIERRGPRRGVPQMGADDVLLLDGEAIEGVHLVEGASWPSDMPTAPPMSCDVRLAHDDGRCLWWDQDNNVWVVKRDGWTWVYGADSRSGSLVGHFATETVDEGPDGGCDANAGVGPGLADRTTRWWLSSVTDPSGNRVEYTYRAACDTDGSWLLDGQWAPVHRLKSVAYDGGAVQVDLEYAGLPLGERATGTGGRVRVVADRLAAVQVTGTASGSTAALARYELTYVDEAKRGCTEGSAAPADVPGVSLLQMVERVAPGGSSRRQLRCMSYDTDPASFDPAGEVLLDTSAPIAVYGETLDAMDETLGIGDWQDQLLASPVELTGDAWPDLVIEGWRVFRNIEGALQVDYDLSSAIDAVAPSGSSTFSHALLDIDGDGRTELLVADAVDATVYQLSVDSSTRALEVLGTGVPVDKGMLDDARFADIDGDGLVDLVLPSTTGVAGDSEWVRNSGDWPWFDPAVDAAVIVLPLESGSGTAARAEVEADHAACLAAGGTSTFPHAWTPGPADGAPTVPSGYADYYDVDEFLASQTRLSDVNGDGIADLSVAVYTCWAEDSYGSTALTTASLLISPPFSRLFIGDGAGGFVDTGVSAGWPSLGTDPSLSAPDPVDAAYESSTWGYLGDTLDYPIAFFGVADLDRSGVASMLQQDHSGCAGGSAGCDAWGTSPWLGLSLGASLVDFAADGSASAYAPDLTLPTPAMSEGPLPQAVSLVADWDADGFPDILRLRKPEQDSSTLVYSFEARLFRNQLATPRARLRAIMLPFGGTISLSWDIITDPALPQPVDVIASVTDSAGTRSYSYRDPTWKDGRFVGFRDVFVRNAAGRTDGWRFALTPALEGTPIVHLALPGDGSPRQVDVTLPYDDSSGTAVIDVQSPWFNPARRRCSAEGLTVEEAIDGCMTADGHSAPDRLGFAMAMGWLRQPGDAPDALAAFWDEDPTATELQPIPVVDPTAVSSTALDQVLTGYLTWTMDEDSLVVPAWSWPSLSGPLPAEVAQPPVPAAPAILSEQGLLIATDRSYNSMQRLASVHRLGRVDDATDDVTTELGWSSAWDGDAMGVALLLRTVSDGSGLILSRTDFADFADFDRAQTRTEWGEALTASRTWSLTWDRGELATQTDPDGGVSSWQRNACGLSESFTDPAGRQRTDGYDGLCRPTSTIADGGMVTTSWDDLGRLSRRTVLASLDTAPVVQQHFYDDTADGVDVRGTWDRPRKGVRLGTAPEDPVELDFVDPWGRDSLVTRCEGAAGEPLSDFPVLQQVGCLPGTEIHRFQGFGRDGARRVVSQPYADGEVAGGTWTWRDELSRVAVVQSPAPDIVPASTAAARFVTTTLRHGITTTETEGPDGLVCTRSVGVRTAEQSCGGLFVGSVGVDVLGRTEWFTNREGLTRVTERDPFGRVSRRYADGSFVVDVDGVDTTVIDPGWSYAWTPGGRLSYEEDPTGAGTVWTSDPAGRPVQAEHVDRSGATVATERWSYADGGLLTPSTVDFTGADGNTWQTTRDGLGRTVQSVAPDGSLTTRSYGPLGLEREVRADGTATAWIGETRSVEPSPEGGAAPRSGWPRSDEGAKGQLRRGVAGGTWRGSPLERIYDGLGRVVEAQLQADATVDGGFSTAVSWLYDHDARGAVTWTEDPDGVQTTRQYAFNGLPLLEEGPAPAELGTTWTLQRWQWTDAGALSWHEQGGVVEGRFYDSLGRLQNRCLGAGSFGSSASCAQWQSYDWTGSGDLRSVTLDGALTTEFFYDGFGQLSDVIHPDGTTEQWGRDALGRQAWHVDEDGVLSEWSYDALGRLSSEWLPGMVSPRTYDYELGHDPADFDAAGSGAEVHTITNPDGGVWTLAYDFAGRNVWTGRPDGSAQQSLYDGAYLTDVFDLDCTTPGCDVLAQTAYYYDAFGRQSDQVGPVEPGGTDAFSQQYGYSDAGRLVRVIGGAGEETAYTYDQGVLTDEDALGLTARHLSYDADVPRLVGEVRSNSDWSSSQRRETSYAYDSLGRLSTRTEELFDGSSLVSSIVTGLDDRDSYGLPRYLSRQVDGTLESELVRVTDQRGRIQSEEHWLDGSQQGMATYAYSGGGRLSQLGFDWTGGGSEQLSYERDGPDQQVSRIVDTATGTVVAQVAGRDAMGRISSLDLYGGAGLDLDRDPLGRVHELWATATDGTVSYRRYTYDVRGRLSERAVDDRVDTYSYREPGWLTQEVVDSTGTSPVTTTTTYDAGGNRTSQTRVVGGVTTTDSYTTDGANRLVALDRSTDDGTGLTSMHADLGWDDLGGITLDHRGSTFTRGADGRVSKIIDPGGSGVFIERDPLGRPIALTESTGDLDTFFWGNPQGQWPLAGTGSAGQERMWVGLEGMLVAFVDDGAILPAASDDRGDLLMLGDQLVGAADAFGADRDHLADTSERFVYAGTASVGDRPQLMAQHRLYDPELGRFLSEDPLGLGGGFHRFAYAENMPTTKVDPVGLQATDLSGLDWMGTAVVDVGAVGVWDPPGSGGCAGLATCASDDSSGDGEGSQSSETTANAPGEHDQLLVVGEYWFNGEHVYEIIDPSITPGDVPEETVVISSDEGGSQTCGLGCGLSKAVGAVADAISSAFSGSGASSLLNPSRVDAARNRGPVDAMLDGIGSVWDMASGFRDAIAQDVVEGFLLVPSNLPDPVRHDPRVVMNVIDLYVEQQARRRGGDYRAGAVAGHVVSAGVGVAEFTVGMGEATASGSATVLAAWVPGVGQLAIPVGGALTAEGLAVAGIGVSTQAAAVQNLAEMLLASGGDGAGASKAAGETTALVPVPKVRGNPNTAPARGTTFVDPKGNAITTPPGGKITGSPDGRFIQARDAAGNPTGVRLDGGHKPASHPDPRAQGPHGHVPDVTNPDGTPWLPIKE